LAAFLGCVLGFLAVLAGGEVMHAAAHVDSEHTRRLAHICSGTFAAFLPWLLSWWQIVALTALFEVVMLASMKYDRLSSVHDVTRTTWGAVCFPAGVAASALAQPPNAYFAFGVLAMAR
jgi:hypothetical protein